MPPPVPGGWAGLSVRTHLTNPSTRPGLRLPGHVTVTAHTHDLTVAHVVLGLIARVESDTGDTALVEFHRTAVAGPFHLAAGRARVLPFALPVPWETPLTVVAATAPLNLRAGLRTEVSLGTGHDHGDLRPLFVHPLPAQERVIDTLTGLGFQLRHAGLQTGRLPGTRQVFPFHQKIGFWVAPLYAGPITEIELTFLTDPHATEVVVWADRRPALSGAAHPSISRFRVRHDTVPDLDWPRVVDGWLRRTVDNHATAATRHHIRQHLPESVHLSRPPDRPGTGGDPGATGGGSGGGGDGT